ncbi:ParM/StbA family protein (plasmid) [Mycoplasmatota bacterium]|nr:ParM/StbA family protein [Mycoplasmatota bacterium]
MSYNNSNGKIIRVVGLEVANSSIKGYANNKSLLYPNTVKAVTKTFEGSFIKNNEGFIAEYEGQVYEVGFVDNSGSGSKSITRYSTPEFKRECIFALSQLVERDDEEIRLFTGTPSSHSDDEEIKKDIINNLKGTHTVKLIPSNVKRTFTITHVQVVAQPVGTLIKSWFNENGTVKNKNEMKNDFCVIDIGWGSTDLLTMVGGRPKEKDTINLAMSDFNKNLRDEIQNKHPESKVKYYYNSLYELDLKVRETDIIETPHGLKSYNIKNIKEEVQLDFAREIISRISNTGINLDNFYRIYITGGGSIMLHKAMQNIFRNDDRISLVENPQMANAIGFYILARQTWH